uniref:Uncharacterized protein n=1 Tax=Stomoxys calcitrans TaxID=35570 RepID=A0A1I8NS39_STOCA
MKIIAILLFCVTAVLAAEQLKPNEWCSGAYLREAIRKCGAEYGATQADADDYIQHRPAANDKMKCYRACLFNECRAFNMDGSFVANAPQTTAFLASRINPSHWEPAEKAAKICIAKTPYGTDRCETVEQFSLCLTEKSPVKLSYEGA